MKEIKIGDLFERRVVTLKLKFTDVDNNNDVDDNKDDDDNNGDDNNDVDDNDDDSSSSSNIIDESRKKHLEKNSDLKNICLVMSIQPPGLRGLLRLRETRGAPLYAS